MIEEFRFSRVPVAIYVGKLLEKMTKGMIHLHAILSRSFISLAGLTPLLDCFYKVLIRAAQDWKELGVFAFEVTQQVDKSLDVIVQDTCRVVKVFFYPKAGSIQVLAFAKLCGAFCAAALRFHD